MPAIVALLAVAATTVVLLTLRPSHPAGPIRRFRVPVPGLTQRFFTSLARSPHGRSLAYEAGDRIWIRRMDGADAVDVPGSSKGRSPFWSNDQGTLCFAAAKQLWAFTPGGDRPRDVCAIPESGEIVRGAWRADGHIFLAVWRGGLYEVAAGGGEARLSLPIDSSTVDFHGPSFLPDGRTMLLYIHDKGDRSTVAIVEENPPRLKRVYDAPRWASVSYSSSGYLLGTGEGAGGGDAVWAVPFSACARKPTGPAFRVMDGAAYASASSDGLLIAFLAAPSPMRQVVFNLWRIAGALPGE